MKLCMGSFFTQTKPSVQCLSTKSQTAAKRAILSGSNLRILRSVIQVS